MVSFQEWERRLELKARLVKAQAILFRPAGVKAVFVFPRPKKDFAKAGKLRKDRWPYKTNMPDIASLGELTLRALSKADYWDFRAQVADLRVVKRYCQPGEAPSVEVTVKTL